MARQFPYILMIPHEADTFIEACKGRNPNILDFIDLGKGASGWNYPEAQLFAIGKDRKTIVVRELFYSYGQIVHRVKAEDVLPLALIQDDKAFVEYLLTL